MKRIISLLLSAALLLGLLPACQRMSTNPVSTDAPTDWPAALDVVNMVLLSSGYSDQSGDLEYLSGEKGGDEYLNAYIENAYGLETAWEDAAIIRGTGASAFELAVLRLEDDDTAVRAATKLMSYIFNRQGDFAGYAPDQADLVANGSINQQGPYAALFICPDTAMAGTAFEAAINGVPMTGQSGAEASEEVAPTESVPPGYIATYPNRVDFVPPNLDDMSLYDTTAIRTAWETGDTSGLSDYDREIYNAAQKVLNKVLQDGMSDLEKEAAVYGWVVDHVNYDWTHQDIMTDTPRESFTPYGGLVNRTAVCLGYATTFQLLMDLAEVKCITVVGAAFQSKEDHGWNMVQLDGNWYCVDVTWDANYREQGVSPQGDWDFFNVTSDEMAASNHQWDYPNTPEAVTEGNAWNISP